MTHPPASFGQLVLTYGPVLLVSFGVALSLTPVFRGIALKRNIVDRPDDWLKPHKRPIPYLGGVAIFLGWAAAILWAVMTSPESAGKGDGAGLQKIQILGVVAAGTLIMGLGLFDDLHLTSPTTRLLCTLLVGILLMVCGVGDRTLETILGGAPASWPGWLVAVLSAPLTLFVVVGACNATNLLDGLDGLCAGVLGISAAGYLVLEMVVANKSGSLDPNRVVLSLAMLGAAVGFLAYNRHPATIFMGDAGSMLLGLSAAVLILLFADGGAVQTALGAILVFGLPIADMGLTLFRRRRGGRPLMQGDRSHFYDQLIDRGYGVAKVIRISYGLGLLFAVFAWLAGAASLLIATIVGAGAFGGTLLAVAGAKLVRIEKNVGVLPGRSNSTGPSKS